MNNDIQDTEGKHNSVEERLVTFTTQQRSYRVTWEIDVSATSQEEAVRAAIECMPYHGNDTTATVFSVSRTDCNSDVVGSEPNTVDIGPIANQPPVAIAIVLQGGIVQNVISHAPMTFLIADHDKEGADADEMYSFVSKSQDGKKEIVTVVGSRCNSEVNQEELTRIYTGYNKSI